MREEINGISQIEQKESTFEKPYVISADIHYLLKKWASQRHFSLPDEGFFQSLRHNLSTYMKQIFKHVELVPEEEISHGLMKLVDETGLHPISLDGIYYNCDSKLEMTRTVDNDFFDKGLSRRFGSPPLLQQIRKIFSLKESNISEVVLVDDVIFSGSLVKRVKNILSKMNIDASVICAGVGIGHGVRLLQEAFSEIRCVKYYDEVIDEVCERDFYPGVPQSGRLIAGKSNVGAPYIIPFGKPSEWASIPKEWVGSFSSFCMEQTITLFQEIEKASGRQVFCRDLARYVVSLPHEDNRYVNMLKKKLIKVKNS